MRTQAPPSRRGSRQQPTPRTNATRTRKRSDDLRRNKRSAPINPNTTIRKRGNVYFMFHKSRKHMPWRVIIALMIVFAGAIGSAFSYAQIHSVQRQIAQTRNALSNQVETNANLNSLVVERHTHSEIERRAYELGLRPPDPSQIIYFYVPLQSGVDVTINDPLPQPENYFWQGIVAFFQNMRDRIFG